MLSGVWKETLPVKRVEVNTKETRMTSTNFSLLALLLTLNTFTTEYNI